MKPRLRRLAALAVGLGLISVSCTSDDDGAQPETATSTTTTTPVEQTYELISGNGLTLPVADGEPCEPDDVAGVRVTADCDDPDLGPAYVDADEMREVADPETGETLRYRYVHGGFEDSPVRFAAHFPERYAGRLYQSTYPTVGSEEVREGRIADGLRNGAAVVTSNNGGGVTSSPALGGVRANAAAAKLAKHLVPQLYGEEAPARAYIYGASGGAYQTIGALESTDGVWAGGVPIVPGTSNAIPSFMTVQLLGLRELGDELPAIADAVEPGGSGDPFATLDADERAILGEVTSLGFPLEGWWQHESLTGGAFGIVQLAVRGVDPGYSDDFWSVPGYEGADPNSPIQDDRIQHETTVEAVDGSTVTVADLPDGDVFGADLVLLGDDADGVEATVNGVDGGQLQLEGDADAFAPGDRVRIDNSWYLALHYYHRYQVPDADQYAWDVLRDDDGEPIHPQRPQLVGPVIADVFGSLQSGDYGGKMIVLSSMNDVEAFPWAADWYRQQVVEHAGEDLDDRFRLWYLENADHITRNDRTHTIDYGGVVQQALLDLDAWVSSDVDPPESTSYDIGELTAIVVPTDAETRLGVQPVVDAAVSATGCEGAEGDRVDVVRGEEVAVSVSATTPPGTGSIIDVEWDFDGSGEFEGAGQEFDVGPTVASCTTHAFDEPGTHFATVRVTSHRTGDPDAVSGRITNLARVRVVVS